LAAAFSGKLVPQEATDEPASILLQRIAAERAAHHDDKAIQARKPRVPRKKVTA
jgi:type I restriction enzyme S subunit